MLDSGLIFFVCSVVALTLLVLAILQNPYHYPYCNIFLDISRRRNVHAENEVEQYILDNGIGWAKAWAEKVDLWKQQTYQKANRSLLLRSLRLKQYYEAVDDDHLFVFIFQRKQTRYRQQNHVRYSYQVMNPTNSFTCSYAYIIFLHNKLAKIGFETTTSKYEAKNQRQLLTQELRQKIKVRDNYTCQICGKYMPDGVGLHIDHIIPISKGGKTVESNLQVLCSVCNGRKHDKMS